MNLVKSSVETGKYQVSNLVNKLQNQIAKNAGSAAMSEEMVFTEKNIVVKTPIQKELAKIKGYEPVEAPKV
jgi:hypothetical protein